MGTQSTTHILLVSNDPSTLELLSQQIKSDNSDLLHAISADEGLRILRSQTVDLIICDLEMNTSTVHTFIRDARKELAGIETILVTGSDSIENTTESVQAGVFDCLTKPLNLSKLHSKIKQALERRQMRHELSALRTHVAMRYGFDNIVGISKLIAQLKETAARIAPTDINILITGPSGTGKELIARTIHHHSPRRRNRFVAIDCSTFPEALIESELLGQTQGTSTDATHSRRGLREEVDGGTLFLDEVSSISLPAQVKLLRFLQDAEVQKVNVRIIAATSRSLATMVTEGTFREDLYYKLDVIPLVVPPLAERMEDVEMLTEYFLRHLSYELSKPGLSISRPAIEKLLSHRWPGNVRELENTLKRAVALCTGDQLEATDITFVTSDSGAASTASVSEGPRQLILKSGLLNHHQREVIVRALDDHRWNFTRTAAALGIGRTTLWRKIKRYNLEPVGALPEND